MGVVFGIAFAAGVGVVVWQWSDQFLALILGAIAAIVVFGIGMVVCTRRLTPVEQAAHQQASDAAQAELDRWNQSFLCMACGTKFIPVSIQEVMPEP
ncbi:MAG: hypothetical protein RR818_13405 [Citrobacter sp.]